jgi:23S rRNA (adenine2030-N6)-methyltransferase
MNYRHSYHAGNFADVVKHLALTAALLHLKKKGTPFAVIDTHAGRGLYDLSGSEAQRTGEARDGIARLRMLNPHTPALAVYLEQVRALGPDSYPGSPLLAARLIQPADRLVALEKHPEEQAVLAEVLKPWRKATAELADGYVRLPKLLPPPERRGLVLIDPPYEQPDEFQQVAEMVAAAYRRFATGIYLIWYPIKSAAAANSFCGQLLSSGATEALRIDIDRGAAAREGAMTKAGLVVLNPPYGFSREMDTALAEIAPMLSAQTRITRLAGEA